MPVRVLIAEFLHETNTFSVQKTDRKCFERGLYLDNEVSKAFRNTRTFMGAGYEAAEKFGWQPVTPLVAEASPSGRVTDACFEEFTARLLSIAKEVDGILLHLHGAMSTESHDDGEGELLARLRSVVGSDIPIVVVIDLHATVTQRMADNANALIAYRTYPHVDQYERGHQAAELLDRAIAGAQHPGGHHRRQIGAVAILQPMHQTPRHARMNGHRAQTIEGGRLGNRLGAEDTWPEIARKRQAEYLAIGPFDETDAGPAARAQAAMGTERHAATGANRRIDDIDQSPETAQQTGKRIFSKLRAQNPIAHAMVLLRRLTLLVRDLI